MSPEALVGSRGREKANSLEEDWKASERHYSGRRSRRLREEWHRYHTLMAQNIEVTARGNADLARAAHLGVHALLEPAEA